MKLLVLLFNLGVVVVANTEPPIVKIKNGLISGYVKNIDPDEGAHAFVYEGIRYGELLLREP